VERYRTLVTALAAGEATEKTAAQLLLFRDEIASAMQKSHALALELGNPLSEHDFQLKQHVASLGYARSSGGDARARKTGRHV
jgi:hypothetical protein